MGLPNIFSYEKNFFHYVSNSKIFRPVITGKKEKENCNFPSIPLLTMEHGFGCLSPKVLPGFDVKFLKPVVFIV